MSLCISLEDIKKDLQKWGKRLFTRYLSFKKKILLVACGYITYLKIKYNPSKEWICPWKVHFSCLYAYLPQKSSLKTIFSNNKVKFHHVFAPYLLMVWSNSEQKPTLLPHFLLLSPYLSLPQLLTFLLFMEQHGSLCFPCFLFFFSCANISVMGSPITSFKTVTTSLLILFLCYIFLHRTFQHVTYYVWYCFFPLTRM